MHLADVIIQSDLQCIQAIHFFISRLCVHINVLYFYNENEKRIYVHAKALPTNIICTMEIKLNLI